MSYIHVLLTLSIIVPPCFTVCFCNYLANKRWYETDRELLEHRQWLIEREDKLLEDGRK